MKTKIFPLILFLGLLILAGFGDRGLPRPPIQEDEKDEKDDPAIEKKMAELRKKWKEAKDAKDEQKASEILQEMKKLRRKPFRRGGPNHFHGNLSETLVKPPNLNLRDIAHYSIAQIYLQQKQPELAIAEMNLVAQKSPDSPTRSAAQFSVGNIYLSNKNLEKAIEAYMRVEGHFRRMAMLSAFRILENVENIDKLAKVFEKFIQSCDSPREKAMAHLMMANLYCKHSRPQDALPHLKAITAMEYNDLGEKTPNRPQTSGHSKNSGKMGGRNPGKMGWKNSEKGEKNEKSEKAKEPAPTNPSNQPPKNN